MSGEGNKGIVRLRHIRLRHEESKWQILWRILSLALKTDTRTYRPSNRQTLNKKIGRQESMFDWIFLSEDEAEVWKVNSEWKHLSGRRKTETKEVFKQERERKRWDNEQRERITWDNENNVPQRDMKRNFPKRRIPGNENRDSNSTLQPSHCLSLTCLQKGFRRMDYEQIQTDKQKSNEKLKVWN